MDLTDVDIDQMVEVRARIHGGEPVRSNTTGHRLIPEYLTARWFNGYLTVCRVTGRRTTTDGRTLDGTGIEEDRSYMIRAKDGDGAMVLDDDAPSEITKLIDRIRETTPGCGI